MAEKKGTEEYNDQYPTCAETYSTLRIFSDKIPPDEITRILGIEPTRAFSKGDAYSRRKLERKSNGWFYSTKELSKSKDTRKHIDFILAAIDGKEDAIRSLCNQGCKIDLCSYWVSTGQGGPWLVPCQMLKLGNLGIEIWWDVYFAPKKPS